MRGRPVTPATPSGGQEPGLRLASWTLVVALLWGGALRLVWIDDIEWKKDERWSYQMSQEIGRTRPWPRVGMPTSLEMPNPGLSVWIFVPIGRIASSPPAMARFIAIINIVALLGFVAAVRGFLPPHQREPWFWGLALHAVSPFPVRLSRKIWPPALLTPFLLLLWVGHRHRQKRWGALTWGLTGALIGQVHLSGWFVAGGLALGTVLAEWRGTLSRSRYWHWWLLGTILGLASAVPWLRDLPSLNNAAPATSIATLVLTKGFTFLYGLVGAGTSLFPYAFLGLGDESKLYMLIPHIDGVPMRIPDVITWVISLIIASRFVARLWTQVIGPAIDGFVRLITRSDAERRQSAEAAPTQPVEAAPNGASTGFYLLSMIAIPFATYALVIHVVFYHYYYVMCPLVFVLLAVFMLPWRRALLAIVIAEAIHGGMYLTYIHANGGVTRGEYGLSYARHMRTKTP
jgi:hypothetical protein